MYNFGGAPEIRVKNRRVLRNLKGFPLGGSVTKTLKLQTVELFMEGIHDRGINWNIK